MIEISTKAPQFMYKASVERAELHADSCCCLATLNLISFTRFFFFLQSYYTLIFMLTQVIQPLFPIFFFFYFLPFQLITKQCVLLTILLPTSATFLKQ